MQRHTIRVVHNPTDESVVLSQNWHTSLGDARRIIEAWRANYNTVRHTARWDTGHRKNTQPKLPRDRRLPPTPVYQELVWSATAYSNVAAFRLSERPKSEFVFGGGGKDVVVANKRPCLYGDPRPLKFGEYDSVVQIPYREVINI
jgi:hypothetical protein